MPPSTTIASRAAVLLVATGCMLLAGCNGAQSVFAPQSVEAGRTAVLTDILIIGATVIFGVVMAIIALALFGTAGTRQWLAQPTAIFSGGVVFPLVTLTALLAYGLTLIRSEAPAGEQPLQIAVEGERWWWRVTYPRADGHDVKGANEIRVPVGRLVRLELTTADVIHSFWVPRLAGKVDMIPGRTNILQFRATAPGTFRGQCAEYCGGAHALMGLRVIALDAAGFDAWLEKERAPARAVADGAAARGQDLFLKRGCAACHAITGIPAVGTTGPNLTHVGGRNALAAERLPMSQDNLARWIRHPDELKPSTLMPSFDSLPDDEVEALSTYLFGLK